MSLLDIAKLSPDELNCERFTLSFNQQSFGETENKLNTIFQFKVTGYNNQDKSELMLQIIDISNSVSLNQKLIENEMLEIINATTSHELRNPLNSMMAQNTKKEQLFKRIK